MRLLFRSCFFVLVYIIPVIFKCLYSQGALLKEWSLLSKARFYFDEVYIDSVNGRCLIIMASPHSTTFSSSVMMQGIHRPRSISLLYHHLRSPIIFIHNPDHL